MSLLDPPETASALAASCVNMHTFPVLAGPTGSRQVMLSSPIILYDYPAVAPESQGDLCDATEIDELLTLRVRTLTEDEKREARATDARGGADCRPVRRGVAANALAQLHGTCRSRRVVPESAGRAAARGRFDRRGTARVSAAASHVRLQPAPRHRFSRYLPARAGPAIVSAVYRTLEDQPYIAVTLDDDPFGAEGAKYRRSLFFHPEELVPLDRGARVSRADAGGGHRQRVPWR